MSKRKSKLNEEGDTPESRTPNVFYRRNLMYIFVILLLALVIFFRTLKNGFTDWDDDIYVLKSELIRHLSWSYFKLYFTSLTANLYTPLVTVSYAIDYQLYGLEAYGYHATNLLLHIFNVLLVYLFTLRIFGRSFIAALTALLFAIHPLNVEAVAWISSRKDLLFSMFYLLGLLAYLHYQDTRKIIILVLVFVLFLLSVLSKPIAFTFPFVLLLLDFFRKNDFTNRQLVEKIPFIIVSIMIGLMGIYLVRRYEVFASAPHGYNWFDRISLAGFSLTFYLYNVFIPADISNYHAYPFKDGSFLDFKYIISPAVVLALLFFIFRFFRKNFMMVAGLLMFLIMIGPTLRLMPTGYPIAADRYFYLASVGLFWTIILIFERIAAYAMSIRYAVIAASVLLVIAFMVVAFNRVGDWQDSYSLWTSTLKNDPYHQIANDHLGHLYDNAGKKDAALVHFQRIIDRDDTKSDVMNSVGNILIEKNQPNLAMQYFDQAIATGKADHLPYYNRGMLYSDERKFDLAIKDFTKAIELKPDFAEAFNNRGIARVQSGDTLGAYEDFQQAVRLKPGDKMMQDNFERIQLYQSNTQ